MRSKPGISKTETSAVLRELLLEEHSKHQCMRIIGFIGEDEDKFKELVEIFLSSEYRLTQRAAWPIGKIGEQRPSWITPILERFIAMLRRNDVHDAVKRNIMRILQFSVIPERYQGELMDICFDYLTSNDTPVAVKAFSLTVLENLAGEYPEIIPELLTVIEDRMSMETAAFASRAKKIIRKFSKAGR